MGKYVWPCPAYSRISSGYGNRTCPFHGKEFHDGVDLAAASGAPIEEVVLCGGIPMKNTLLNQMYADILRRPIRVSACKQAPALGSAINAAAAAGVMSLSEAIARMHDGAFHVYTPDETRAARYDLLYAEYARLSDYFGRGENRVMERLLAMRAAGKERKHGR